MNLPFGCRSTVIAAISLAATPAWADLTAQDVWNDWQGYMLGVGYEVSGSESMSGNTLTLSNVKMSMPIEEADGEMAIMADKIEFRENGDGTVAILMPATMPMSFSGSEEGADFAVKINMVQTGHNMTASGTRDAPTYNYSAASMAVQLASIMADGEDMSENAKFDMTMSNLSSTTHMKVGDLRAYDQRIISDSLSYNFAFSEPGGGDNADISGKMSGISFEGGGNIPMGTTGTDLQQMLNAGFSVDGAVKYASGETNVAGTDSGSPIQYTSASQGGELRVAMDSGRIIYDAKILQSAINMVMPDLPFPVALEMVEAGFHMLMPVAKSDEEQDFELSVTLGDFTMSDMIWSIFDGGGVLPRDPATILVDLAGKAKVLVDFLDPDFPDNFESDTPGELNALTIKSLLVSAAGAEVSGTGDFTFDNTDLETFDGLPRPTGAVDLKVVGANGLIDKLIQMGFVSDQDAMGARMMMGMLAVPGEGEDTLTSKLEINAEGHIIANGQRIQ